MRTDSSRWTEIGTTQFPWEREALDYVHERLPVYDPYRGYALFEFIATDGSINEVDLLVIGSTGLFLVEIKSWPGVVNGDQRAAFRFCDKSLQDADATSEHHSRHFVSLGLSTEPLGDWVELSEPLWHWHGTRLDVGAFDGVLQTNLEIRSHPADLEPLSRRHLPEALGR